MYIAARHVQREQAQAAGLVDISFTTPIALAVPIYGAAPLRATRPPACATRQLLA